MEAFNARLKQAIRRVGPTKCADALGYSTRQIYNWEKGMGIAKTLQQLEELGIVHINDGSCTCANQIEVADVTA